VTTLFVISFKKSLLLEKTNDSKSVVE